MKVRLKPSYLLRSLVLVAGAIVVNIVLGYLVRDGLRWPVYLDSIGTILVGALRQVSGWMPALPCAREG